MSRSIRAANEIPTTVVVLVSAVGLVAVAGGHWRKGLYVIAAGLIGGAVMRLVLPTRRAGLLAVRSKIADVVTLTAFGVVVAVLAYVVPTKG